MAENQEFLLLSPQHLARWISSDDLNVPSEEDVFQVSIIYSLFFILKLDVMERS